MMISCKFLLVLILALFSVSVATDDCDDEIWSCDDWADLETSYTDALEVLGYDEVTWNSVTDPFVTTSCVVWELLLVVQQEAAGVIGFDEDTWDAQIGDETECPWWWYEELSFTALPGHLQEAAITLGYNQNTWDNDSFIDIDCYDWSELNSLQLAAAEVLGYTEERWNGTSDDDWGDDTVDRRFLRMLEDADDDGYIEFCNLGEEEGLLASLPCLSGYSQVEVLGKGTAFLEEVEQGDKVLVSSDSLDDYQEVFLFGHKDVYAVGEMLQITTSGNRNNPLEITGQHLVLKQTSGDGGIPVRADSIEVGDFLIGSEGVGELVTQISSVRRPGLYSPVTKDGTFLANGILVSSYTAMQDDHPESFRVGSMEVASYHFMNHASLAPFRLLCLASDGFKSLCEQRNHEGQLLFASLGESYTYEKKEQILGKQIFAALVFSIVLVPFYFMEQLLGGFAMMCLFPVAWLLAASFVCVSAFRNKKKIV